MLEWFRARTRNRRTALEIYGALVAAARAPHYYAHLRVPDTPEGRFEMVCLMMFLVLERLKAVPGDGEALTRQVIEAFVIDMDDCLREMGVGDLAVPKRVKRAAAAFFQRGGAYREALNEGQDGELEKLAAVLSTYVFRGLAGPGVHALAGEVAHRSRELAAAPDAAMVDFATLSALLAGLESKGATAARGVSRQDER